MVGRPTVVTLDSRDLEVSATRVVAIHQPNCFPWLGFFDKIANSDVFVVLDNVQFPKTGGAWSNRVRILIHGSPAWITVPVVRSYSGTRLIAEMRINESTDWRAKLLTTIAQSYAKAPHCQSVLPLISALITERSERLAEYNIRAIRELANALNLSLEKMVLGSELQVSGSATDLLVDLVNAVGGDTYLSGQGAGGYQEDEKFAKAGIRLRYQEFRHPVYPQIGGEEFVSGLSIIDALMNCGIAGTSSMLGRPLR